MATSVRRASRRGARGLAFAGLAIVAAAGARAEEPAPAAGAAPPEATAEVLIEPEAAEPVRRMVAALRDAQRLAYEAETEYDAVQADGESIEFGSRSEITIRRPDRAAGRSVSREGRRLRWAWDGNTIGVYDETANVYATAAHTGDIDSLIDFLRDDVGLKLPIADLFSLELRQLLVDGVVEARYVGKETLDGVECDHVALRSRTRAGIQLWIERSEESLPRRIVITYEGAEGSPQFRARLDEWDLSPSARDSRFELDPPKGAKLVPFVLPKRAAKAAPGEGAR
jgi:hypothetical protein